MKTKNEVQSKNVKCNLVELTKEQQKEIIGVGWTIEKTEDGKMIVVWK